MQNKTLMIGVFLLIVGVGVGYVVGGGNNFPSRSHMMSDGSMMSQNIDQHFIVQMIPHHEGAIAMAKLALERSSKPEVLSLAEGIISAQEKEIADMQRWYEAWFGTAPVSGGMHGTHMDGMTGDLDTLSTKSGVDFDREFLEQMIPHHEMAIMMAQMLQAATQRDEMKVLADNIITSQSREIQMMRSWLSTL